MNWVSAGAPPALPWAIATGSAVRRWGKWSIKTAGGKHPCRPSVRNFLSRGMPATFDTSETEAVLNWKANDNRKVFVDQGIVRPARALRD